MPQISVIVPVYNTELYLKRCIDSILNQSFNDFELILVDDGSTDNSGKICDEYANRDERVKVIHKENGGVSSARNAGIDRAECEWVMFVDSDDFIYNDMLKEHLNKISKNSCDLSIVNNTKRNSDVRMVDKVYTPYELITNYCENYSRCGRLWIALNGPWSKLYRRSLLIENSIYFPANLSVGEDVYFNMSYLEKCGDIIVFNDYLYEYCRENENSLDTRFHEDAYQQLKCMHDKTMSVAKKLYVQETSIKQFEIGISIKMLNEIMKGIGRCRYKILREYMVALSKDTILKNNLKNLNISKYVIGELITKRAFYIVYLLYKLRKK